MRRPGGIRADVRELRADVRENLRDMRTDLRRIDDRLRAVEHPTKLPSSRRSLRKTWTRSDTQSDHERQIGRSGPNPSLLVHLVEGVVLDQAPQAIVSFRTSRAHLEQQALGSVFIRADDAGHSCELSPSSVESLVAEHLKKYFPASLVEFATGPRLKVVTQERPENSDRSTGHNTDQANECDT